MPDGADPFVLYEAIRRSEPPRPLMRELPPADPFPTDALGATLGAAALAIHDRVQAPIAIAGQSVLGAANLAVQAHANVELPIGGGSDRPVSCYLITVAGTGERKSACDEQALWPISKHEAKLREQHQQALPDYANDKLAWEKARERAVKSGAGVRAAIKTALDALGPAPSAPLEPMLTCPEPTFEGLCKLFAIGQPSLGLFTAEGGSFVGGHGLSDDSKLRTASGLSELWDGRAIRRVRGGDGASMLPGRRLCAHLMLQPGVADRLFGDDILADQGLLSRLNITAPESAAGTRLWHEEQPETDLSIKRYGARLLSILERPLPLCADTTNELAPRKIVLLPAAAGDWRKFADYVEKEIGPGGKLQEIRGLANKLPEHGARLAAILALVDDIDAGAIDVEHIEAGIALAEHYAAEALRLFGGARVPGELVLARRLLDWLLNGWPETAVSLPDIYQFGPNAVRDKATAEKLVKILIDHGWLEHLPNGAMIAGHRRRDAWCIVRGER